MWVVELCLEALSAVTVVELSALALAECTVEECTAETCSRAACCDVLARAACTDSAAQMEHGIASCSVPSSPLRRGLKLWDSPILALLWPSQPQSKLVLEPHIL